MRLATFALAFAALSAVPSFAVTLTVTPGCTANTTGFTSTLAYTSSTVTDPAGNVTVSTPFFNAGTNPGCGGANFLSQSTGQSTTFTFAQPVSNVGFVWGSPDTWNTFQIYSGATLLASYTGSDITNVLLTGVYYTDFAASGITSVVFSASNCCFETENFSYTLASVPVPEPSTFYLPAIAAGMWFTMRRRRS